ncbi:MAG: glycosyltransferase [Phycisphaerae bacterium]|nr:glycosyltransferase [Phycisphaerae bacterium]
MSRPPAAIADALIVTLTRGGSLAAWRDAGLLEREWALYARLARRYPSILLLSYGGADEDALAAALEPRPVVIRPERDEDQFAFLARAPSAVAAALPGIGSAVVRTNQMEGGEAAITVAAELRRRGVRVGLVARGGYGWSRFRAREFGPDSPQATRAAGEEGELCRAADVVIGTTRSMLDELCWRHAFARARTRVVPNYVLTDASVAPISEREPGMVLFAGRLVPQKRVDLLLDAAACLPAPLRSTTRVLIVGSGPEEKSLRERAARLAGAGVRVEFRARAPHAAVLELMQRCAVFAQCSEFEGHPKTVFEAMSVGAPVLVTHTPGLGEAVVHEHTGLRVEPDVPGVAAGLARLLADARLRASLGTGAAAWARAELGVDRIAALEAEVHAEALSGPRGKEPGEAAADRAPPVAPVRFEPALLQGDPAHSARRFADCLHGFAKRLPPRARAVFVAALDAPLYAMQGEAAIAAEGGLHPKHRLTRYHDFFVERLGRGERVLDLGCGVGALALAMQVRAGARVTGMDWSEKNLHRCRAAEAAAGLDRALTWLRGDITVDRAPGGFDTVVLSNVLEHLRERPALLRRYRDWYGARRFLIRVPAFDREWRVPWKKELGVEWRLDDTHETEYTEGSLRSELTEAGLAVSELIIRWGEIWCVAE